MDATEIADPLGQFGMLAICEAAENIGDADPATSQASSSTSFVGIAAIVHLRMGDPLASIIGLAKA